LFQNPATIFLKTLFQKAQAISRFGTVEVAIKSYTGKAGKMDTVGLYRIKTVDSPTQKPVPKGTEVEIPLTDVNQDVTNWGQSYVEAEVKINVERITGWGTSEDELPSTASSSITPYQKLIYERTMCFAGWKSVTDAIGSLRLLHEGRDIGGTEQTKAALESWVYHRCKPDCEKQNKSGTYSLFEDVENYDVSMVGCYFSMWDVAKAFHGTGTTLRLTIKLIIPFDSIFCLMGFSLYPKRIFGGMSLMIKFCTESMVFCRVNPTASIRRETRLHHSNGSDGKNYKAALLAAASALEDNPNAIAVRNRFYQIGTPVSLYGKITLTVEGNNSPPAFTKIEVTNTLANFAAPNISFTDSKSRKN
jgi:hypothetical protein